MDYDGLLITWSAITGSLVSSDINHLWFRVGMWYGQWGVPWLCGSQLLATCGYSWMYLSLLCSGHRTIITSTSTVMASFVYVYLQLWLL